MSSTPEPPAGGESPYEVLGLRAGASEEEIEDAYRELSVMFAPGAVPEARLAWARRQRARLATAYAELMDPDRKEALDRRLGVASPPAALPVAEIAAEPQFAAPDMGYVDAAGIEEIADVPAEPDEATAPDQIDPGVFVERPAREPEQIDAAALEETADVPAEAWDSALSAETAAPEPFEIDGPDGAAELQTTSLTISPTPPGPVGATPAAGRREPARPRSARRREPAPVLETSIEPEEEIFDEELEDEVLGADLEEDERAPWQEPPARFTPSPRQRVTPRPAAQPGAERGVNLPSRREAAQMAAAAQAARAAAPPAAPAPPRRSSQPPAVARRTPPPPARSEIEDFEVEEQPRLRRAAAAPPPPRPQRKRRKPGMLGYQLMTGAIAVVLILGTIVSVFTPVVGVPTPQPARSAAELIASGDQALAGGNEAGALANYQQALATEPNNQRAMLALARLYASQTPPNVELARQYISQIIETNPQSEEATQALGLLARIQPTSTAAPAEGTPNATAGAAEATSPTPPAAAETPAAAATTTTAP